MATKKGTTATQFKILVDGAGAPTGEVEFYASVFENVDLIGDRVKKGAFTKSLDEWRAKDAPIPVIFSHAWDDAWAIIGAADPKNVVEDEIGLKVKATLDIGNYDDGSPHNPMAKQIFRLMDRKLLKEASFAYDVVKENKARDGANDLGELSIIEVGPTLKGMNPATGDHAMLVKDLSALAERMGLKVMEAPHEEKIGARNSSSDAAMIQSIHDASMNLGATCAPSEEYKTMSDVETKDAPEVEVKKEEPGTVSPSPDNPTNPEPEGDETVEPSPEGEGGDVAPSPTKAADEEPETKAVEADEEETEASEDAETKAKDEEEEKAEETDSEAKSDEEKSASDDKEAEEDGAKDDEPAEAKSDEPDATEALQRRVKADLLEIAIEEDLEI